MTKEKRLHLIAEICQYVQGEKDAYADFVHDETETDKDYDTYGLIETYNETTKFDNGDI